MSLLRYPFTSGPAITITAAPAAVPMVFRGFSDLPVTWK
jgi:hypothetical protein